MKEIPREAIILCNNCEEAEQVKTAAHLQYPGLHVNLPDDFRAEHLKDYRIDTTEEITIYIDTPGIFTRNQITWNWGHVTRGFSGPIVNARDLLMAQDLTSSSPSAPDPPSILLEFPQIRNVE